MQLQHWSSASAEADCQQLAPCTLCLAVPSPSFGLYLTAAAAAAALAFALVLSGELQHISTFAFRQAAAHEHLCHYNASTDAQICQ